MHELNHGAAGKGDKERSPGWRNHYNEIEHFEKENIPGLVKLGPGRFRKIYGHQRTVHIIDEIAPVPAIATENFDTGAIEVAGEQITEAEWYRRAREGSEAAQLSGQPANSVPALPQDQHGDACGCSPRAAGAA